MITLLLTAPMCHALSFNLHHSAKEKAAQEELDKAKRIADSARSSNLPVLKQQLNKIELLLADLQRNKADYKQRGQKNQLARTEKRIGLAHLIISHLKTAIHQKETARGGAPVTPNEPVQPLLSNRSQATIAVDSPSLAVTQKTLEQINSEYQIELNKAKNRRSRDQIANQFHKQYPLYRFSAAKEGQVTPVSH
jgi:hypothetical protein